MLMTHDPSPQRRRRCTTIRSTTMQIFTLALTWMAIGAALPTHAQRLFFSLYMHSSGQKAVEIYNPSCFPANLTEFTIRVAPYSKNAAGAAWGNAIVITGSSDLLASMTSASLCKDSSGGCTYSNNLLDFSGSDAVGLFHNHVLIDIIGSTNEMAGESCLNCPNSGLTYTAAPWIVSGVVNATKFHTLKRVSRVYEGSVDFFYPRGRFVGHAQSSEWNVSAPTATGTIKEHLENGGSGNSKSWLKRQEFRFHDY